MSYAIMRIGKIKAKSSFAAIERHDKERHRLKHRKNPEREKENRWIQNKYHEKEKSLTARFEGLTDGLKYRKDAVLAFEVICAYSPEMASKIPEREWIKENLKWLSENFGGAENVVGAFYHCDETTPHLHAIVVPIVKEKEKEKRKLSAYSYVKGKESLSKLQDSYAAAMKGFGLERGRKYADEPEKPSAHHKKIKEYWADVEKEMEALKENVFGKEEER